MSVHCRAVAVSISAVARRRITSDWLAVTGGEDFLYSRGLHLSLGDRRRINRDPLVQAVLAHADPGGCIGHPMASLRNPLDRLDIEPGRGASLSWHLLRDSL